MTPLQLTPETKRLIILKTSSQREPDERRINYRFFARLAPLSERMDQLITCKSCPWPQAFFVQNPDLCGQIGSIQYVVCSGENGSIATSVRYYPKGEPEQMGNLAKYIHGFGYYLESRAVMDLMQTEAVSFITTSAEPSLDRQFQLRFVGLPTRQPIEIQRWLEGLHAGIRHSLCPKIDFESV